jgi:S-adenosylmethionine:tRNA ribosyltransferase-isomerase
MRVDLFDYPLPPERIALEPATPREAARMLVVGAHGSLEDRRVGELPEFLRPGDAVVVNDTRVIAARLDGIRARGDAVAKIEAMLIRRVDDSRWRALVRPAKKLRVGERIRFGIASENSGLGSLDAEVESKGEAGEIVLNFALSKAALDEEIERIGQTPLPPYIATRRPAGPEDREAYQTIFACEAGAVAAPTAGLHFTPALLARIEAAGARLHRVTLHVGAGTFLPVKVADTSDHVMHSEWGRVDAATALALNAARARGGRIVAIGTTSLRLLESAADASGSFRAFEGETAIFITPGYGYRAVDVLFTNFHLPRSTLLMLVSAFCGPARIRAAYAHAVSAKYRFYSYGDACLLHRAANGPDPGRAT